MARIDFHPHLKGLRGRIGGFVFRRYGNNIVVSERPSKSAKPRSKAQRKQQAKMSPATAYAKAQMADPEGKAYYIAAVRRNRGQGNRYSRAIGDFMSPPEIHAVDASAYRGREGDVVEVSASDNVGVVRVEVAVLDATGQILEHGDAEAASGAWRYTARRAHPHAATIRARAWDRPQNVAEEVVGVPGGGG